MMVDDDKYLLSIRKSIEEVLFPELRSAEAKRVADIVTGSLDELLRRQLVLPGLLLDSLPEAIELVNRLEAQLPERDAEIGRSLARLEKASQYGALGTGEYKQVLAILEQLLSRLQVSESSDPQVMDALRSEAANWENSILQRQLAPIELPEKPATFGELSADHLQQFIASRSDELAGVEIRDFERIPGGMSKHTYSFVLKYPSGKEAALIARKVAGEPLTDMGAYVLHREFDLMVDVSRSGFLAPEPLWLFRDEGREMGDYYVMRKLAGQSSGSIFAVDSHISEEVLLQMAHQMAKLHAIDIEAFRPYIESHEDQRIFDSTIEETVGRYLDTWIEARRSAPIEGSPMEVYGFEWLRSNVPRNKHKSSLIHGDFTPHNCMWQGEELTGVIDWECAHFGDPAADLAHIRPHIEARMDWQQFLDHYVASGGRLPSEEDLHYYNCLFYTRTSFQCNITTNRVTRGVSQDITHLHVDYEYHARFMKTAMDTISAISLAR